MGIVYMAEQETPVKRRVALKIIKPGLDSASVIARFEAERQALAMMDHQNIARVFDAGTTDSGRPYFVMELVHGIPITKFCDDSRLTLRERLELFVPVCQAIQHAHQKGIIHRDIKPSNVLVTMYDDQAGAQGDRFRRGDGKLWLVGRGIFDADTGKKRASLEGLTQTPYAATFSADGRRLVTSSGELPPWQFQTRPGDITVWDTTTGKALKTRKDAGNATSLAYHPDGRRVAVFTFGPEGGMHAKIWDTETGKADQHFNGYGTSALFSLSPDGRWLATIVNFDVILWEVRTGKIFNIFNMGWHVSGLAFSRDGRRLATGMRFGNAVKVWDVAALIEVGEPLTDGTPFQKRSVAFSPDGKHVACTSGFRRLDSPGWVRLHDAATGRQEWQVNIEDKAAVFQVAFHPAGDRLAVVVTGGRQGRVMILAVKTGEKLREFDTNAEGTNSIAFSPDGRLLATACADMTVRLRDTATGQERRVIDGHHGIVFSVAFSPDGTKVLSGGYDSPTGNHQVAILWDVSTGKELWRVEEIVAHYGSLAFSRDGKRIATPSTVRDAATGEVLFEMKPNFRSGWTLAFSPDGRRVATDGMVTLFDVATGQVVARLKDKDDAGAENVAFSPDGKRLAVVNDDGTLQIYDATPLRPE